MSKPNSWANRTTFLDRETKVLSGVLRVPQDERTKAFLAEIAPTIQDYVKNRKRCLRKKPETVKEAKQRLANIVKCSKRLEELLGGLKDERSAAALFDSLAFGDDLDDPAEFDLQKFLVDLDQVHEAAVHAANLVPGSRKGPVSHDYDQDFIFTVLGHYQTHIKHGQKVPTSKGSTFTNFIAALFKIILPDETALHGDIHTLVTAAARRWKERAQYPHPR